MEIHAVQNRKENCHHDHIPFNLKGNIILVFSVQRSWANWETCGSGKSWVSNIKETFPETHEHHNTVYFILRGFRGALKSTANTSRAIASWIADIDIFSLRERCYYPSRLQFQQRSATIRCWTLDQRSACAHFSSNTFSFNGFWFKAFRRFWFKVFVQRCWTKSSTTAIGPVKTEQLTRNSHIDFFSESH